MSFENTESLPPLACPLIASPAVGRDEKPLRQPPFPEIDRRWDGFTLSHLHLVGINVSCPQSRKRRIKLARLHESCHEDLALTPYSLHIKYLVGLLYSLILKTFREEREQIRVPLKRNKSGNELRELGELIARFKEGSRLVEEVFAVRSSLLKATKLDIIEDKLAQELTTYYKDQYEKYVPFFRMVYEDFDLIARRLGETSATAIIYNALETGKPNGVFVEIIAGMRTVLHDFLWSGSGHNPTEIRDFIVNLSFEDVNHLFSCYTEFGDPDDSLYFRKDMFNLQKKIKKTWRDIQSSGNNILEILHCASPATFLFHKYTKTTDVLYTFTELEGFKEVEDRNFVLLLEAIWQQLTHGIGLQCPFWMESSHSCCGGSNRVLLEKVWSCTKPDLLCNWERLGCLKK